MKFIEFNLKNAEEIINRTADVLKAGGLVVFPTDTVYGLLADATNKDAVGKLIEFKNRPPGKPVSVFVSDFIMLNRQVKADEKQKKLLKELLPGPFTVVLQSRRKVDSRLESEKGTLGVRLTGFIPVNRLVSKLGKPVTATSANLSSRRPHYSVKTLVKEIGIAKSKLIDLVIDAGKLSRNRPSTIIDFTENEMKILRKGDVVFKNEKSFISDSPEATQKLGRYLMKKYAKNNEAKPNVFIIEGEMGSGKTVFVKGMGSELGIKNIVSPTYVIYYEYGRFIHFDLYQIENSDELHDLEINKMLVKGNTLVFEWGEKIGEIYELLKSKANIVYLNIDYINEKERRIRIKSQL